MNTAFAVTFIKICSKLGGRRKRRWNALNERKLNVQTKAKEKFSIKKAFTQNGVINVGTLTWRLQLCWWLHNRFIRDVSNLDSTPFYNKSVIQQLVFVLRLFASWYRKALSSSVSNDAYTWTNTHDVNRAETSAELQKKRIFFRCFICWFEFQEQETKRKERKRKVSSSFAFIFRYTYFHHPRCRVYCVNEV